MRCWGARSAAVIAVRRAPSAAIVHDRSAAPALKCRSTSAGALVHRGRDDVVRAILVRISAGGGGASGRRPAGGRLSSGTLRATEGRERHALRDGIVIAQVAMAVVLMTASGLLVRSYQQLAKHRPWVRPPQHLVGHRFFWTVRATAAAAARNRAPITGAFFEQLSALPGGRLRRRRDDRTHQPARTGLRAPRLARERRSRRLGQQLPASVRIVTPGYFAAMGIRVSGGRAFDDRDAPDAPRVLMVSEGARAPPVAGSARHGQQLVVDYSTTGTYPYEVVGVVGDLKFSRAAQRAGPGKYFGRTRRRPT